MTDIKIPTVGESITSGLLSVWHKNHGDPVTAGEILFTLETDKVSTEVTAEHSGVLQITIPAGSEVKIGQVVGILGDQATAGATAVSAPPDVAPAAVQAVAVQPVAIAPPSGSTAARARRCGALGPDRCPEPSERADAH